MYISFAQEITWLVVIPSGCLATSNFDKFIVQFQKCLTLTLFWFCNEKYEDNLKIIYSTFTSTNIGIVQKNSWIHILCHFLNFTYSHLTWSWVWATTVAPDCFQSLENYTSHVLPTSNSLAKSTLCMQRTSTFWEVWI